MQESLSLLVLHEITKVIFGVKFDQMNFIRLLDGVFNYRVFSRADSQQKSSVIFCDSRNSDVFKLMENCFLSFLDVE